MAPVVIQTSGVQDPRDIVHQAVQALAEGRLVAFPTETVYGIAAGALCEEAVQRLLEAKGRPTGQPMTLAIRSSDEALDYVPDLSPLGQRLARRCWPGPLTLVAKNHHPESLLEKLPASVQAVVVPNGTVGLRVPAHPIILDVLRMLTGPIVLTSANRSGQPDASTAEEVVAAMGDKIDLVLDAGKSHYSQPSSVVRVEDSGYELLREGVVSAANLQRLSSYMLLLVCTGNTCRSPMAAALARMQLAKRLSCDLDELGDHGVVVSSAGIAAMTGGRASSHAVEVMADQGVDLARHKSQPLTEALVRHADLILTMTRGHRDAILAQWPQTASRVKTLSCDEADVSDPIGGSREDYDRCAEQIKTELERRVVDLEL